MEIRRARALRGPNLWADRPVAEIWLDLSDLGSEDLPGLCRRLAEGLRAGVPGCAPPRLVRSKSPERHRRWIAETLERLIRGLSTRLGPAPAAGEIRLGPEPGIYRIGIPYREESVPEACAETALAILDAIRRGDDPELAPRLAELESAARAACPSPAAAALIAAAQARGIPVRRLGGGLAVLGQGARQQRLLARPPGGARESGGDGGRGEGRPCLGWGAAAAARAVAADRETLETLLAAAGVPCAEGPAAGAHYRLLVAGGQVAAALRWRPGNGSEGGLGSAAGCGEPLHPELAARALDAARALGLDLAEVRLIAADPSRPLEDQGGAVAEVIPDPDLDPYLAAAPQCPVVECVLESRFPLGEDGRIPVLAVTGTNGKTTVTRLLAHALGLAGRFVGMTCTDGIYLGSRRIDTDDCAGPKSARLVLLNPQVEAAVLETARGGIIREGLGFDACDIAVITNIGEGDHLGLGGIETAEQLAEVKGTLVRAVAPWGTAVLNAADPLVVPMAALSKGQVLFFARDPANPVLAAHRRAGGRVAFVRDQGLVLAQGESELKPIALGRIPITRGGCIGFQVENALACAGALWALGLPSETLLLALETFGADLDGSPGRFNMLAVNGATAVFDYGHNPSALLATIEALGRLPQRRRIAVYSAAGDRRDADMIRQGEILGDTFDLAILYEDAYVRGRAPGEITALFRQGLARGSRVREVRAIPGWGPAVDAALALAEPGDLLLVQADTIDEAVDYVRKRLASDSAAGELPEARGLAAQLAQGPGSDCPTQLIRA
jgi:cyanophycin synthetase